MYYKDDAQFDELLFSSGTSILEFAFVIRILAGEKDLSRIALEGLHL